MAERVPAARKAVGRPAKAAPRKASSSSAATPEEEAPAGTSGRATKARGSRTKSAPAGASRAAARTTGASSGDAGTPPPMAEPTTAAAAVEGATMAKTAEPKTAAKATAGKGRGSRSASDTEKIRAALAARHDELKGEYDQTLSEIAELQRDRLTDSAGDDQADTGTKTFEREQEISLANNILERITQVERALERLEEGNYGWCERCGNAIPVERLAAFPSATLCVSCKQLEERR